MQLTFADICFDRQVKTKDEALQRVVAALTHAGHTRADYLQGMREREGQISTYLGNGIAIPHGTPHSRDAVLKTGVKVLACPQGVDWGEEQTAYLIVGIAAQDNEHRDILRQLTHALGDDRVPEALTRADTPRRCWKFSPATFLCQQAKNHNPRRNLTKRPPLPCVIRTGYMPVPARCW
ncbi:PTS system tagatose-specific transporter subunit IIA-TPr [Klebsiella pneumoniae]|nr:PTS system tagatose-specific transporter subunit IIA-TPr [Klebsiella pneumoniae]VGF27994.1 PTS system tagatose-specific transporter subunit IIA-TPr [Klebsiella pneumoniae]